MRVNTRCINSTKGTWSFCFRFVTSHSVTGLSSSLLQRQIPTIQYNLTLLPSVNTLIARGMFCGAKYTHHTFTPIIKHLIRTTANKHPGKKSFIDKNMKNPTGINLSICQCAITCFGIYSVGTHRGNLLKSCVAMSRVTFLLRGPHWKSRDSILK